MIIKKNLIQIMAYKYIIWNPCQFCVLYVGQVVFIFPLWLWWELRCLSLLNIKMYFIFILINSCTCIVSCLFSSECINIICIDMLFISMIMLLIFRQGCHSLWIWKIILTFCGNKEKIHTFHMKNKTNIFF